MENSTVSTHGITLNGRKGGSLTGVKEVLSYSDEQLILDTAEGALTVSGKELKIGKFSSLDGTLAFSGQINALKYDAPSVPLLKRIFK